MASTTIPAHLTADLPKTFWGKVLASTPVVMTVIATALAGLSNNEMNRAQYDRALGAQVQGKASDQWSFFQAKRLRAAMQSDTAEILVGQHGKSADALPAPAYAFKTTSAVPQMPADVQQALQAQMAGKSDERLDAVVAKIPAGELENARKLAEQRENQFDAEAQGFDNGKLGTLGRLRFSSARYDSESRLDQDEAYLYELLVRQSNLSARRHHDRSQHFFIGMLISQMAVIIATFALAARRRNVLWTIAAVSGVAALVFSVYVYLWT